ncbi:MAG: ABC transporter substrate-binding protein [Acidisphaera sp.]|nr:ABC transporter substrate-binding protein [Acidisphaera sp.]
MPAAVQPLRVALGNAPRARAVKSAAQPPGASPIDFADIVPIHRAFAPMVRELRFDLCELAIATFLQAKAFGKPLVLLPVAVMARFQESALLCRGDDATIAGPADLVGKRVGVRAYSQTTGVWLRGELADEYGVAADSIRWVTFENAHVAEYADPPWAERARPGQDMLAMLREGELDAAIGGSEPPDDPSLRTVFSDPDAAASRFQARHGFMPVNHLLVARQSLVEAEPERVAAFCEALVGDGDALPSGRAALDPAIGLVSRYCLEQGLLPRPLSLAEVWEGLPPQLLSLSRSVRR